MQEKQNSTALVWFRNDLRTQDNLVLHHAMSPHQTIIALYCFDPRHFEIDAFGFKKTKQYRAQFLIETIHDLKLNLNTLNIELFVYNKKPENCISEIIKKYNISNIYIQKEWTSEEAKVLNLVKDTLPIHVNINQYYGQFLYHPDDIKLTNNNIPKVFTNFRKHIEKQSYVKPLLERNIVKNIVNVENKTKIPTLPDLGFNIFKPHANTAFPFKGGENSALKRLDDYFFKTKKLGVYKKTRNGLIGKDFSSKFSPWLANGSISAKTIYWYVKQFEKEYFKNESTYWLIFELIWRDYFKYISLKHANNIFKIGGILDKDYEWSTNEKLVEKWIEGKTNSSFVNANMIELKKTGWMSNRGRQNVASYFSKNLMLDWRIGAAYFESMLIDYDVHSNYGNWMYIAGVGNDPRDRKFNIKLQAERYDTKGKFQNLWLQNTLF